MVRATRTVVFLNFTPTSHISTKLRQLRGTDANNPLVSPIHADLRGLPPFLIYVGSAETLLDDSVRLAAVAGAAGVHVTLENWPDMIDALTLFYPEDAVARRALVKLGAFMRSMTSRAP